MAPTTLAPRARRNGFPTSAAFLGVNVWMALYLCDIPIDVSNVVSRLFSNGLHLRMVSRLFGISIIQLYNYCDKFWLRDSRSLKSLVAAVMVIDTIQQALVLKPMYTYLIVDFGNFEKLQVNDPGMKAVAITSGFVVALAQALFVNKVYILSKNVYWASSLAILVAVEFSAIMVYYSQLQRARLFSGLGSSATITIERVFNALMFFTDLCLAGSLVFLLRKMRSGFPRTDAVVKRIIAYTASTSAITAMVAFLSFIFAFAYPHSLLYLALDLIISKLYINCMFVVLNSRSAINERLSLPVLDGIPLNLKPSEVSQFEAKPSLSQSSSQILYPPRPYSKF